MMAANKRDKNDFFLIIDILTLYSYLSTLISLQLIFLRFKVI